MRAGWAIVASEGPVCPSGPPLPTALAYEARFATQFPMVRGAHQILDWALYARTDLYYIKRLSLWFDLSILVDTVKVVLLRIGAR